MTSIPTKRGGKRPEAERKPLSESDETRTETLRVKVEPDIAAWLKSNGGEQLHYDLLRQAYLESLTSREPDYEEAARLSEGSERTGEDAATRKRPKRLQLSAEETLRRMQSFPERKDKFVAAIREGKD